MDENNEPFVGIYVQNKQSIEIEQKKNDVYNFQGQYMQDPTQTQEV